MVRLPFPVDEKERTRRSENFWLAKWRREDRLIEQWEAYGSIYASSFADTIRSVLINDLQAAGYGTPDPEPVRWFTYYEFEAGSPSLSQLAAFLVPTAGRYAECEQCSVQESAWFWCTACCTFSCRSCVYWEMHKCSFARKTNYQLAMQEEIPQAKGPSLTSLPAIVSREQLQLRIEERVRFNEEQVIAAAHAAAEKERARLQRLYDGDAVRRQAAIAKAERLRLRSMPPAVRRIVQGTDGREWIDLTYNSELEEVTSYSTTQVDNK